MINFFIKDYSIKIPANYDSSCSILVNSKTWDALLDKDSFTSLSKEWSMDGALYTLLEFKIDDFIIYQLELLIIKITYKIQVKLVYNINYNCNQSTNSKYLMEIYI